MTSAKLMHIIATATAVLAFGILAVAFVLGWPAYYQVAAGLAAIAGIEWQQRETRKSRKSPPNHPN